MEETGPAQLARNARNSMSSAMVANLATNKTELVTVFQRVVGVEVGPHHIKPHGQAHPDIRTKLKYDIFAYIQI
jgi:hypothetical protein